MATITVQAVATDGRTVLWERDARHPVGECFLVADGRIVTVGDTPTIRALLAQGLLTEVAEAAPPPPAPVPAPAPVPTAPTRGRAPR